MVVFSIISLVTAVIGYEINSAVLSKIYHFKLWEDLAFKDFSFASLEQVINALIQAFGFETGAIFSTTTILNGVALVFLVAVTVAIILGLKEKQDKNYRIVALFFLVSYVVYVASYCVTTLNFKARYNLPIVVFGIPLVCFALKCTKIQKKQLLAVGLVFLIAVSSAVRYNNLNQTDKTQEYREIAKTVSEKGYAQGYASFWNANVLTELSNGEIEMRSWDANRVENLDSICEWLQIISHSETKPQGPVFLLFSMAEKGTSPLAQRIHSGEILYQSENYIVYGYPDYEAAKADCDN